MTGILKRRGVQAREWGCERIHQDGGHLQATKQSLGQLESADDWTCTSSLRSCDSHLSHPVDGIFMWVASVNQYAILRNVKWYSMLWVCIFLIGNHAEHLLILDIVFSSIFCDFMLILVSFPSCWLIRFLHTVSVTGVFIFRLFFPFCGTGDQIQCSTHAGQIL